VLTRPQKPNICILSADKLLRLILLLSSLAACEGQHLSDSQSEPLLHVTVVQNSNPKAPLVALLSFSAPSPYSYTRVHLRDDRRSWTLDFDRTPTDATPLPIVGLRSDTSHHIGVSVSMNGVDYERWSGSVHYRTPGLPTDRYRMPQFRVANSEPERMEPGITMLSVRRALTIRPQDRTPAQHQFMANFGLILGIDNEGEIVWYYETDERISGIDRLRNGNLIYHKGNFETVELDLLGNTVGSWYAERRPQGKPENSAAIPIQGIETLHHQPHEVRGGSFLSFSANSKVIPNWYTSEYDADAPRKAQKVMGDTIIEFARSGEILWAWNAFDYLDPYQIGYEALDPYWTTRGFPQTWDWTHGNGVSHDPRDDSIVASFKLLDAIIKIDRESKAIKWIFGDHAGWGEQYQDLLLSPVGEDFRWPWHQHNPRWTHAGTLLVFNNNRGQTKPFDGQKPVSFNDTYSYSAEYQINEETGTVEMVWISESEPDASSCSSWAMSEAHRLPTTDHILEISAMCHKPLSKDVTWDPRDRSKPHPADIPHGGRVREYTRTKPAEVVFELDFRDPDDVIAWQVYGGFRTPELHIKESKP